MQASSDGLKALSKIALPEARQLRAAWRLCGLRVGCVAVLHGTGRHSCLTYSHMIDYKTGPSARCYLYSSETYVIFLLECGSSACRLCCPAMQGRSRHKLGVGLCGGNEAERLLQPRGRALLRAGLPARGVVGACRVVCRAQFHNESQLHTACCARQSFVASVLGRAACMQREILIQCG